VERKARPHTVIPAQAGTQWSAKRDQNNDSFQVPTRPVMPTQSVIPAQVGTQWSAKRDLTPSYPRRRVPSEVIKEPRAQP